MNPRSQGAAVAGPPRNEREPSADRCGQLYGLGHSALALREARAGQDQGPIARLPHGPAGGFHLVALDRCGPLASESPTGLRQLLQERSLFARPAQQVFGHVPQPCAARMDHEHLRAGACGLPDPQVEDGDLLLRVEAHHHDGPGPLDVAVRHGGAGGVGRLHLLGNVAAAVSPVIEVIRVKAQPGQLRERVVVLVHQPSAREESHPPGARPPGDRGEGFAERHGLEARNSQKRRGEPLRGIALAGDAASPEFSQRG